MSEHNEIRGYAALLVAMRKMVGGDFELAVNRLSETLQPIINPFERSDWAMLRNELLAAGNKASAAGGAGKRSIVQLRNPAATAQSTAARVLVIESITGVGNDGVQVELYRYDTALANFDASNSQPRDTRIAIGALVGQLREDNSAALPGTAVQLGRLTLVGDNALGSTGFFKWDGKEFVLAPGTGIIVCPSSDNVAFNFSFCWRERPALPGELAQ